MEIIPEGIFYSNLLQKVTIPSTVRTIGMYAFSDNNIVNVNIADGVERIEESAFGYNQLTEVIIPSTVAYLSGFDLPTNGITGKIYLRDGKLNRIIYEFEDLTFNFLYFGIGNVRKIDI